MIATPKARRFTFWEPWRVTRPPFDPRVIGTNFGLQIRKELYQSGSELPWDLEKQCNEVTHPPFFKLGTHDTARCRISNKGQSSHDSEMRCFRIWAAGFLTIHTDVPAEVNLSSENQLAGFSGANLVMLYTKSSEVETFVVHRVDTSPFFRIDTCGNALRAVKFDHSPVARLTTCSSGEAAARDEQGLGAQDPLERLQRTLLRLQERNTAPISFGHFFELPHESKRANRMKPFNIIKGRKSLVTLQRSPLRGPRVLFVAQTPQSPFYSVHLCRLVW